MTIRLGHICPDTVTLNDAVTTSGQSISDTGSSVDDEENSNPGGSSAEPFNIMSGISEVLNLLKLLGDGHRHLLMYNCRVYSLCLNIKLWMSKPKHDKTGYYCRKLCWYTKSYLINNTIHTGFSCR